MPIPHRSVILLDDVFRGPANDIKGHPHNLSRLCGFLAPILSHLDVPMEILGTYDFCTRRLDPAPLIEALGITPSLEGWVILHESAPTPAFVERLSTFVSPGDLIVGYELPNCLFQAFTDLGHVVIDIGVGPIRFLADLCFEVRTNSAALLETLSVAALPETEIVSGASQMSSMARGDLRQHSKLDDLGRIGLLLGQFNIDTAVMHNSRMWTLADCKDDVLEWASDFDTLLFKPHPYSRKDSIDSSWIAGDFATLEAAGSVYQLFAHPNVAGTAALSSGALSEARYFATPAYRMITPPRWEQRDHYLHSVSGALFDADLWATILHGTALPKTPIRLPSLRNAFGQAWGYSEKSKPITLKPLHENKITLGQRLKNRIKRRRR